MKKDGYHDDLSISRGFFGQVLWFGFLVLAAIAFMVVKIGEGIEGLAHHLATRRSMM